LQIAYHAEREGDPIGLVLGFASTKNVKAGLSGWVSVGKGGGA